MGKRSTSRRLAMQALYQADIGNLEIEKALENTSREKEFLEETKEFAKELARGAWKNKAEIDKLIIKHALHWSLERISGVDRSILRLATYELRHKRETPQAVVINEALELAKKYSTEESSKFINGVLGGVLKDLRQYLPPAKNMLK